MPAASVEAAGGACTAVVLLNGVRVDAYFADYIQTDFFRSDTPTMNWGSILLCRTGPKEFNVRLAQRARQRGLCWVLSQGICRDHEVVASDTEEDIFLALGMAWKPPEERV